MTAAGDVSDELLRQVDWRFLLQIAPTPRCLDLTDGATARALALVTEKAGPAAGEADLAVLGYPTKARLRSAREALGSQGEVVCLWRAPRPAALSRARARLKAAGFGEPRFYRPGLLPGPRPALWLPLDAPAACEQVLAERPPRSRGEALRRRAWRRFGPVCALARTHDGEATGDRQGDDLPAPDAWVLLTGGAESDAKVVGLPYFETAPQGHVVAKFARVDKADRALEREAEILLTLERERPGLAGVPRLRARGRRAGQTAIVQDAARGKALNTAIDRSGFAAVAAEVTEWLAALAGRPAPQAASSWAERLVLSPLDELERDFAALVATDLPGRARDRLAGLGDLPLVCEHRDFGPWNIVLDAGGSLAAIDWEDAEPQGLPGLDLAYFLATAAFEVDGGLEPAGKLERARERNRDLLDLSTELGAVAQRCVERYCATVGINRAELPRLRLLCWLLQALIALRRLPAGATGSVPAAADAQLFLCLAEDELLRLEGGI